MNDDWKRIVGRLGLVLMLDGLFCVILTVVAPEGYAIEKLIAALLMSIGGAAYIGLGD